MIEISALFFKDGENKTECHVDKPAKVWNYKHLTIWDHVINRTMDNMKTMLAAAFQQGEA